MSASVTSFATVKLRMGMPDCTINNCIVCLIISRRFIVEKKEVNLVLLGSDLQLQIHLPVEQCSDSDGAIHRAQCVTDCVLVCLCISSLQTTSVGRCV